MKNSNNKSKRILIVEDDFISADVYHSTLSSLGFDVVGVAHNSKEAIKSTKKLKPDVIFLDISMDYKTAGIDVCKEIKKQIPEIKVYFMTAYDLESFKNELVNVSFDGYVDKLNFIDSVSKFLK